jgi:anti-sigma factor ChrR (cupin superfamily)
MADETVDEIEPQPVQAPDPQVLDITTVLHSRARHLLNTANANLLNVTGRRKAQLAALMGDLIRNGEPSKAIAESVKKMIALVETTQSGE